MRSSTGTHMRSPRDQPVNIQHFMGVLAGARKGQRAGTQRILQWLKLYTQIGSDAYMYCNFLTHILLHKIGVETFHRFFCFFFQNSWSYILIWESFSCRA